ncbi:alpha/beta fold hydrolase [Ferrimonas lipolytica]|uniref:Alpha/beta fold hydrolase n=1 Tax=Ferrimonas lipolytica TaxID=2724191 RepID=A0A6H1UGV4_9GAMM|nr:alpha/beta fold hydrolase [Ferrimonas lipolytica]QIZ78274.1 alpha/beta fold hydrolase [Ferrimonas lipolytica]
MTDSVTVTELWQQAEHGNFAGVKGVNIRYCIVRAPQSRGAIVLCSGRIESYMKYWPLVQWLYDQGYSLYLWDHRGQGLSERMLTNRHIGHVHHFRDYVADMVKFVRERVTPDKPAQRYLLAHSMGGAIAALYLHQYPHHFDKALLSSPMFGVQLPAPSWVISPLLSVLHQLRPEGYAVGGHNYRAIPFADNDNTHDENQYRAFRQLYQDRPELQLGAPSVQWIRQALALEQQWPQIQIETPTVVAIAGADTVVNNKAARLFAQRGQHELICIDDAMHELLMESDDYRQPLLNRLLEWFAPQPLHDLDDATAPATHPVSEER